VWASKAIVIFRHKLAAHRPTGHSNAVTTRWQLPDKYLLCALQGDEALVLLPRRVSKFFAPKEFHAHASIEIVPSARAFRIHRSAGFFIDAAAQQTQHYKQTNLVSDIPGMAAATDPNLVNVTQFRLAVVDFWMASNLQWDIDFR
jgi:hypothetical protein